MECGEAGISDAVLCEPIETPEAVEAHGSEVAFVVIGYFWYGKDFKFRHLVVSGGLEPPSPRSERDMLPLAPQDNGWEAWTRTKTKGFKDLWPTISRPPKIHSFVNKACVPLNERSSNSPYSCAITSPSWINLRRTSSSRPVFFSFAVTVDRWPEYEGNITRSAST